MESLAVGNKNRAVGSTDNDEKEKYDGADESYVKKLEAKVASLEKARKKEKAGTEQHIAFLESRLDEANRLAKFLNAKKTKMTIEKQQLEDRAKVLEQELIRLREAQQEDEAASAQSYEKLATSAQSKGESESVSPTVSEPTLQPVPSRVDSKEADPATTVDESEIQNLVKQITELESRLVIANKVAEYLKKTIADANEKNRLADDKTSELEAQVEGLRAQFSSYEDELNNKKFKLAESKRILQFASSNLTSIKKEKAESEDEYEKQLEEKDKELSTTKELLETAQTALSRTQEEKKELEGTLVDIEFKLSECQRVSKYMQDTAVRLGEDKKNLKAKVEDLETELAETQRALACKASELDGVASQASEQNATVAELLNKVEDYESQLGVAKKTMDFLQVNLSNAERENHATKAEATKAMEELDSYKTKVTDLENEVRSKNFKLAESKRILNFVQEKVKTVTEDKEQDAQEYKSQLIDAKNKLTETKRILGFVKDKLNRDAAQQQQEKDETEQEMAAMKSELADVSSKAEYLQDIVVRVGKEKEDLEEKNRQLSDEVARLTKLAETQGNELSSTAISAAKHELNAMELSKQMAELEGRMKVTDQLVEYLENEWRMALVKLEEQSP